MNKIINLTPHELTMHVPGQYAATCGAYHWCRLGSVLPADWDCPVSGCLQYIEGRTETIPPSGKVARLATQEVQAGAIKIGGGWADVVPVYATEYGDVVIVDGDGNEEPFPEPADYVVYVTSALVADRLRRVDVMSPHVVRDGDGRVIGADGLVRHAGSDAQKGAMEK